MSSVTGQGWDIWEPPCTNRPWSIASGLVCVKKIQVPADYRNLHKMYSGIRTITGPTKSNSCDGGMNTVAPYMVISLALTFKLRTNLPTSCVLLSWMKYQLCMQMSANHPTKMQPVLMELLLRCWEVLPFQTALCCRSLTHTCHWLLGLWRTKYHKAPRMPNLCIFAKWPGSSFKDFRCVASRSQSNHSTADTTVPYITPSWHEKYREKTVPFYATLLDLSKAFYMLRITGFFTVLQNICYPS